MWKNKLYLLPLKMFQAWIKQRLWSPFMLQLSGFAFSERLKYIFNQTHCTKSAVWFILSFNFKVFLPIKKLIVPL